MKFSKASGALPRTPLGGLQRHPDPQLQKGHAAHGLSCFARLTIVLLFTFFVLRPDQFLFRCYGPVESGLEKKKEKVLILTILVTMATRGLCSTITPMLFMVYECQTFLLRTKIGINNEEYRGRNAELMYSISGLERQCES